MRLLPSPSPAHLLRIRKGLWQRREHIGQQKLGERHSPTRGARYEEPCEGPQEKQPLSPARQRSRCREEDEQQAVAEQRGPEAGIQKAPETREGDEKSRGEGEKGEGGGGKEELAGRGEVRSVLVLEAASPGNAWAVRLYVAT